jgi:hypothetical protein
VFDEQMITGIRMNIMLMLLLDNTQAGDRKS